MTTDKFSAKTSAKVLLSLASTVIFSAHAQVPKIGADGVQNALTIAQIAAKHGQVTGTGTFSMSGVFSATGKLSYVRCYENSTLAGDYHATGYFEDGGRAGWISAEVASAANRGDLDETSGNNVLIRNAGADTRFLLNPGPYSATLGDGVITLRAKMFDMDDIVKPVGQRRLIVVSARFDCAGQLR